MREGEKETGERKREKRAEEKRGAERERERAQGRKAHNSVFLELAERQNIRLNPLQLEREKILYLHPSLEKSAKSFQCVQSYPHAHQLLTGQYLLFLN